jgi:hypothetical protein
MGHLMTSACAACTYRVAGGTAGCQARFDRLIARDFSDALYFRAHRMLVDTYCLQHPQQYCASAKSFAAHLAGLCWFMQHSDVSRAIGPEALQRWLSGRTDLVKPEIPAVRGTMTIGDIDEAANPLVYAETVEQWAGVTWDAYRPLHATAQSWLQEALRFRSGARGSVKNPRSPG